ncbi:MAG: ribosome biogenesis protein [Asgard group archaeon]|nr:ribosome biogenesis protein [Asgard group archaeon]
MNLLSLNKCSKCGSYTMQEKCPKCNEKAYPPVPAKFSLEHSQKYSKYRRELKKQLEKK